MVNSSLIQQILVDLAQYRVYLTHGRGAPKGRRVIRTKRGKQYYLSEKRSKKDIDSIVKDVIKECEPELTELQKRWEEGFKRKQELDDIINKAIPEKGWEYVEESEEFKPIWDEFLSLPGNERWLKSRRSEITTKKLLKRFTHEPYDMNYGINSYNPVSETLSKKLKERFNSLSQFISKDVYDKYIEGIKNGNGVKNDFMKETFKSDKIMMSIGEGSIRPNASYGYIINVGEDYVIKEALYDGTVLAHEFGHCLEEAIPEIKEKCTDFLKRRTEGLTPTKLYEGRDEMGIKDSFVHHYVGKIYESGGTEVLSMGIQCLIDDPLGFYEKDPEHFKLTVELLGLA
jgi:hypothetical protein